MYVWTSYRQRRLGFHPLFSWVACRGKGVPHLLTAPQWTWWSAWPRSDDKWVPWLSPSWNKLTLEFNSHFLRYISRMHADRKALLARSVILYLSLVFTSDLILWLASITRSSWHLMLKMWHVFSGADSSRVVTLASWCYLCIVHEDKTNITCWCHSGS